VKYFNLRAQNILLFVLSALQKASNSLVATHPNSTRACQSSVPLKQGYLSPAFLALSLFPLLIYVTSKMILNDECGDMQQVRIMACSGWEQAQHPSLWIQSEYFRKQVKYFIFLSIHSATTNCAIAVFNLLPCSTDLMNKLVSSQHCSAGPCVPI